MPLPLEGLLVVSIEQAVAAPQCTCRLADAGARVIKVERPEGDFARHYDYIVHGESAHFVWLNRGKESLVLDLGKPRRNYCGYDLLGRLVAGGRFVERDLAVEIDQDAGVSVLLVDLLL